MPVKHVVGHFGDFFHGHSLCFTHEIFQNVDSFHGHFSSFFSRVEKLISQEGILFFCRFFTGRFVQIINWHLFFFFTDGLLQILHGPILLFTGTYLAIFIFFHGHFFSIFSRLCFFFSFFTRKNTDEAATSHQPPATSHQPLATSHQPPGSPATSHQHPATSNPAT